MSITYYVALPFVRTDDGLAPGAAQECQSAAAAVRRADQVIAVYRQQAAGRRR